VGDRPVNNWWWALPVVVVGLYFVHTRTTLTLAGIVAIVAGMAVALDLGGAADSVPSQLARGLVGPWNPSRGSKRTIFALLAVWGVVIVAMAR
jgi:hypothetical protein